jgi:histidine ammonia-lyase
MLAVVASQAFYVTDRQAPRALRNYLEFIRAYVPPVIEDRMLGPELGRLTNAITTKVFGPIETLDSKNA